MSISTETGDQGVRRLSHRETQVLTHLADGKSTKEIAFVLEISSKTVETHRRSLMEKLRLYTLPELTKFAIKAGLSTL